MQGESLKELKEISQLLSKNGLTPDTNLEEIFSPSLKSLVLPCHDKENRALVIKILLSEDPAWRQKFFTELQFHKALGRRAQFFIPKTIKTHPRGPLPFILFEKIDGSPLSSTRISRGAKPEWAPRLADLLKKIQNISPKNLNLPRYDGDFLIKKVQNYREDPPVPRDLFREALSQLEDSREKLNNACQVLVHGDFMLQNIIETDSQLFVVDWEFVGIGNKAYDAATLWLTTLRLPSWRKMFLQNLLEQTKEPEVFKRLFILNLLRLYLREIKMWGKVPKRREATLIQRACEKELRLALSGFDSLFGGG